MTIKMHASMVNLSPAVAAVNPWRMPETSLQLDYRSKFIENVRQVRFFYRTEPIVATVINKLVEFAISGIDVERGGLSENEYRVFLALRDEILPFFEQAATEYLLSGLVVPEIGYGTVDKDYLSRFGVKKYTSLVFPRSMYVRDPTTIKINMAAIPDKPSYYVVVPDDVISFIKNKGVYPDGMVDKDLYDNLRTYYPEFVRNVESGKYEFLLAQTNIVRRKWMPDNPYPIGIVEPALSALQHKRRLRRMDFSILEKIRGAILQISIGSDEFPLVDTEESQEYIRDLEAQLIARNMSDGNLERMYHLITNHVTKLQWITPDASILLDTDKYKVLDDEIISAMGFPRIFITGEALRTQSTDHELAIIGPVKTMEAMQRALHPILTDIFATVAASNNFKVPKVSFAKINLHAFSDFVKAMQMLYNASAVSRRTMAEHLGLDFDKEVENLAEEMRMLREHDVPEFGPAPYSRTPSIQEQTQQGGTL